MAGALENGDIAIWRIDKENEEIILFNEPNNVATAVEFNVDGTQLFAGFQSGKIVVWDMIKNELIINLEGHSARISQIIFSKNSLFAATSSFDHTVRIWEMLNLHEQPIILDDHDIWVDAISFSPDNEHIISGTLNKVIRFFPLEVSKISEEICQGSYLESKKLSATEWERYVGEDIPFVETCSSGK